MTDAEELAQWLEACPCCEIVNDVGCCNSPRFEQAAALLRSQAEDSENGDLAVTGLLRTLATRDREIARLRAALEEIKAMGDGFGMLTTEQEIASRALAGKHDE